MKGNTVLVLAEPNEPQLTMLHELRDSAEIVVGNSRAAFEKFAASASVLFNWSGSLELLRDVVGMAPHLRWVHSRSVGLERTLFPELVQNSAILTNGRGVFSASLGEFALASILYFAKDFRRLIRNQMAHRWDQFDVEVISGKTVGIVGYGDIGRAVATRVCPLGMEVIALKRHALGEADPLIRKTYLRSGLWEMLSLSDYIVVSTPLTEETRGMIAGPEFSAMRPTAVVINVGRGPVIEEEALVNALREGRIRGAALDVFDQEPLPSGHPFYEMENVLLSPHCADHTSDWLEQAMRLFIEQYLRFRRGEALLYVVDKKLGY